MTKKKPGSDYSMQSVQKAQKEWLKRTKEKGLKSYSIRGCDPESWQKFSEIAGEMGIKQADCLDFLCDFFLENK